jgi:hypothetical protein
MLKLTGAASNHVYFENKCISLRNILELNRNYALLFGAFEKWGRSSVG